MANRNPLLTEIAGSILLFVVSAMCVWMMIIALEYGQGKLEAPEQTCRGDLARRCEQ